MAEISEWRANSRLLRWLRGEHNSLRHRYIRLPREYMQSFLWRALGKSYSEYYAKRMDQGARKVLERPLSEAYLDSAVSLFEYVRDKGLTPGDRVLDYGCGVNRIGVQFIKYLEPHKFTGVDISALRLEKGYRLGDRLGLPRENYSLMVVKDCHLDELRGQQFDLIWSFAVFGHLPPDEWRIAMRSLHDLLADDGRFFFTFRVAEKPKRKDFKDFWYPEPEARRICEEAGFKFEIQPDFGEDGEDQRMVLLTKA